MKRGIWYGIAAYFIWGLFPIYWKWLAHISALQLIGHRIVWSCVFLFALVLVRGEWRRFRDSLGSARVLGIYAIAGVLIAVNWLIYVWAVNRGNIVETSLGYFINPLISILLGVFILRERLRAGQWFSVAIAAAGVLYLTYTYGSLPWISLSVACTFGTYGLVKKKAPLGAAHGLAIETAFLLVPAVLYLAYAEKAGRGAILNADAVTLTLLAGCGVVTTAPLLLFGAAAQRIPLSMIGLLQYIAPTLQFLLGVFVYKETFTSSQFAGFAMVWIALALFAVEGTLARRV